MDKNSLDISIIIIGYNSQEYLLLLLESLSFVNDKNEVLEIIYVDDGSTDKSFSLFKNFKLDFSKKSYQLEKNMGRVFARQKGVALAKGKWFLFLNSNVTVDINIITNYKKTIDLKLVKAYAGSIVYQSEDIAFEKYLNHYKRGLNSCVNNECVHYKYLLFSNCLVRADVFKNIDFNFNLKYYGGEEIDFSYRLHCKYPNQVVAAKGAIVRRVNVPPLEKYLKKLFEYGNKNLHYLSPKLQKEVVKYSFLLPPKKIPLFLFGFFSFCGLCLIKIPILRRNYFVIRILLLLNIVRGFYTIK